MKKKRNRVLVGLSGGIDSSVSALLLKKQEYEVAGGLIILEDKNSKEVYNKVKKITDILEIPLYSFDATKEFEDKIISKFIQSIKEGITPNPCIHCNGEIKFGIFLQKALDLGFDYIATGHYAQLKKPSLLSKKTKLLMGVDRQKDQSYFLWELKQFQLVKTIFPLGKYNKKQVEFLAKKNNLFTDDIKESQEICFAPVINEFLKEKIGTKQGKIIDINGRILGEHQGFHFYTIGQRKGLNLPNGPFFIVDKNIKNNSIIVSRDENNLYSSGMILKNVNWISGNSPKLPLKIKARIRYGQKLFGVEIISEESGEYRVAFNNSQKAVTPGQSAVFYKNNELIGGGIIKNKIRI